MVNNGRALLLCDLPAHACLLGTRWYQSWRTEWSLLSSVYTTACSSHCSTINVLLTALNFTAAYIYYQKPRNQKCTTTSVANANWVISKHQNSAANRPVHAIQHCTRAGSLYFLMMFESNVSQKVAAVIHPVEVHFCSPRNRVLWYQWNGHCYSRQSLVVAPLL